jgi:exodeoxyribonuclease VII small subunit
MPTGKSPAASNPPPDFESAMQRLESIVERIESTRLPLNELLASYEEGTKLVKVCTDHLATAEKRIEVITRAAGAEPQATALVARAAAPAERNPKTSAKKPQPTEKSSDEVSLF